MTTIETSITDHIVEALLNGDGEELDSMTPLMELNIVDSAGIFDLVHFLQAKFGIAVPLPEVSPENFATVNSIAALVERLRTAEGGTK